MIACNRGESGSPDASAERRRRARERYAISGLRSATRGLGSSGRFLRQRPDPLAESHKASLRCAVYTRVSTEHGLEQEFNSLDNQREGQLTADKRQYQSVSPPFAEATK